jgi:hypothetical protein
MALLFSVVLVLYDAVAALIARSLTISYDSFLVLSLVLIFFMGIYAGRKRRGRGVVAIAIAAAIEATAGWYVAALIGPGYVPGWTMKVLIVMAVEGWLLSTAIGFVGVGIGLRVAGPRGRLS